MYLDKFLISDITPTWAQTTFPWSWAETGQGSSPSAARKSPTSRRETGCGSWCPTAFRSVTNRSTIYFLNSIRVIGSYLDIITTGLSRQPDLSLDLLRPSHALESELWGRGHHALREHGRVGAPGQQRRSRPREERGQENLHLGRTARNRETGHSTNEKVSVPTCVSPRTIN